MSDLRVTTTEILDSGESVLVGIGIISLDASVVVGDGAVTSVNGDTGDVVLTAADVSAVPTTRTVNGKALSASVTLTAADVGAATTAQGAKADTAVQPGALAPVATSGLYSDLTGKPTLGTAAAAATGDFDPAGAAAAAQTAAETYADTRGVQSVVAGTGVTVDATDPQNPVVSATGGGGSGTVESVVAGTGISVDSTDAANPVVSNTGATAAQGALADSAVQPADLATVATTGDYDDLTGTPTLGTAAAADTGDFATAAQGALADSATQPGDLATVATTGAYSDLTGTPTIPDSADDIGAVPTTRTVNGHALSADITVTAADVAAVPTTRTVGGHALSSDVALADADISPTAPNDQIGTTYTFVLADGARLVTGNNASAQTFTIPPNSSVAYPLGALLEVYQKGAGAITLAAGSGVTIRTPRGAKTAIQYGMAFARQVATDVWAVGGDVTT